MKRQKRSPRADKRAFARTAAKTKEINLGASPRRGGIRL